MDSEKVIELLNKDVEDEHGAIIQYLSHAYAMGEGEMTCEIEALAREEMRHLDWLAETIVELGGIPSIKRGTMNMAGTTVSEWMAANVGLDILLIPRWSYVGASIATLAAEVVLLVSCFYVISREVHVLQLHRMCWKPLFCGLAMGGFLLVLHPMSIFFLLPLGAVIYFGMLFLVGAFSSDETVLIKEAILFPGLRALRLSFKR